MENEVDNLGKNQEKIDSDKWGWMVCFGTVITFVAGIGHVNSFGLIYKDFMSDTNSTAQSLTTAHGVFAVMLAVGGITLNIIRKSISLRLGGTIGATIMLAGSFGTIFIKNTNQLPYTFGILQGIGFGMIVPVCYSTLNHYYVRKRTTVMSICKALQGIILIMYPQLIKIMKQNYGFRGTLLLLSGIALHTIPGMIVMKTKVKRKKVKLRTANSVEKGKGNENVDLLKCNNEVDITNNLSRNTEVNRVRNKFLNILNIMALKDPVYCNICIGQSFVNFSDLLFFMLQPMLLYQYKFDTTQVATCISICAGADVAGRCALALISSIVPINTRLLFYAATFFTLLFRIALLQSRAFYWVTTITGFLGVLRAWLHVASPLTISNHVSHEDFPGAYALFMLTAGLVHVSFAPLIGLIKDIYGDYVPAFYVLSLCCVPCLILWPIEYFLRRNKNI